MIYNDLHDWVGSSAGVRLRPLLGTVILGLAAACGGDNGGGPPPLTGCEGPQDLVLAPGARLILDASSSSCIGFPAAGGAEAEYLVAVLTAPSPQVPNGLTSSYMVEAGENAAATLRDVAALPAPDVAAAFHAQLRQREAALAYSPRQIRRLQPGHLAVPPTPGSTRAFDVCADPQCSQFVSVAATARYVGTSGAIYLDNDLPAPGLTQADVDTLGFLFDEYLFPIDTTAFGRESDIDGNGVVIILLTDAVNALSGGCASGGLITGYFFGNDLLPGNPGSNAGEVFYGLVPDLTRPACNATRDRVMRFLAPTLIHEFQHMISYNQHVLVGASSAEHTWLNEGLSHYAEELGARLIPNGPGQGDAPSRSSQFVLKDLENAFDYLSSPETYFLVTPGTSAGRPPERGASWLFLRWAVDQFGGGDVLGTSLTRALASTSQQGADNISARTGRPFDEMVAEWQLANYLDDLPDFVPVSPRLTYTHMNLRATMAQVFPVYPLRPDTARAGYSRTGVLRAGSGRHLLVVQDANAPAYTLSVTAQDGSMLPAGSMARVAIARIR